MAAYFEKNSLCKICCSFDDNTLTEITLDLLLKRRSYTQIKQVYDPMLPSGVKPLNDVNLNNHRKHSDGESKALIDLARRGEPTTEKDILVKLFHEKYENTKNSKLMIQELFKQRLSNAQALQSLLDATVRKYDEEQESFTILEKQVIQDHILELTSDIDSIYHSLQDTFLKKDKVDKGIGDNNVTINNVVISDFQSSIKDMMEDIVDYLLREFKDDPNKGKLVVSNIARIADNRVTPVINRLVLQVAEDVEYEETA